MMLRDPTITRDGPANDAGRCTAVCVPIARSQVGRKQAGCATLQQAHRRARHPYAGIRLPPSCAVALRPAIDELVGPVIVLRAGLSSSSLTAMGRREPATQACARDRDGAQRIPVPPCAIEWPGGHVGRAPSRRRTVPAPGSSTDAGAGPSERPCPGRSSRGHCGRDWRDSGTARPTRCISRAAPRTNTIVGASAIGARGHRIVYTNDRRPRRARCRCRRRGTRARAFDEVDRTPSSTERRTPPLVHPRPTLVGASRGNASSTPDE